jgi:hypothetical protein
MNNFNGKIVFTIDSNNISNSEVDVIRNTISRSTQARYADINLRIGNSTERWHADWIKNLKEVPNVGVAVPKKSKVFTVIPLDSANRMLRAGFGKHDNKWFIRIDLWFKAFRLVLN